MVFFYPWIGCRYITEMETKGCARLAHIGNIFLCICSRFIDAYDIFYYVRRRYEMYGSLGMHWVHKSPRIGYAYMWKIYHLAFIECGMQ